MTASEPPAKWGADICGDDDVVCRVEEGRATAARRRRRGNQGKEEWNSKMADSKAHQVPEQQNRRQQNTRKNPGTLVCSPWVHATCAQQKTLQHRGQGGQVCAQQKRSSAECMCGPSKNEAVPFS